MEQIAAKTANIILRKMKEDKEPPTEMVSVKEAARILNISENHMRRIKDQFPHIKNGNNSQGHILFVREALLKTYAK
ncbi:MAG: helix-turn-helix domain-containing protein [Prevotella sp.]|nr:helix-turn-helix domain-containing protein [Prevotella sp.]